MKTLDRRMTGHDDFEKCVDFGNHNIDRFIEVRNWCWEQWGSSCEFEYRKKLSDPNPSWCWLTDEWRIRIYLRSTKEVSCFLLRWGYI